MNASTDSLLSSVINDTTSVDPQPNLLSPSDVANLQNIFLLLIGLALYIAYFVALFCLDKPAVDDFEKNPLPPGITVNHIINYLLMGAGHATDDLSDEEKRKIEKYLANRV